jgi:FtsP/CotA-like multicopper oxidase with cupredoxin domain
LIGSDGGLLDRPHTLKEAFLAAGERLDVLLDLSAARVGDALTLVGLPFDPMHHEADAPAAHRARWHADQRGRITDRRGRRGRLICCHP